MESIENKDLFSLFSLFSWSLKKKIKIYFLYFPEASKRIFSLFSWSLKKKIKTINLYFLYLLFQVSRRMESIENKDLFPLFSLFPGASKRK